MSSSLDNLELCRLCLVKDRVSVPIFEDEGDVRQIFLKITACLPVKVSREDKLPKKICDDCVYKVELFYQFWNTTANAEKQLLQWLDEVGGLEDKQGYITNVLDSNVMKQERNSDNRLDGNVMQVSGHQNNMDIGMIENMTIMTMPAGDDQQFTAVPMDASGTVQTVQAVPGPSNQTPHDQMAQSQSHLVEEEEEDMEDDNSDDGCDNEEGLPVKEETEDQSDQPLEPTAFVNVPLPCDEAGPSGLQQQKISEISEMSMQQTAADGDPKTGLLRLHQNMQLTHISQTVEVEPVEIKVEEDDFEEVTIDGYSSSAGFNMDDDLIDTEDEKPVIDHTASTVKSVHVKEMPVFTCKPCKIFFPQRQMLDKHMRLTHIRVEPERLTRAKIMLERLKEKASGYRKTEEGTFTCCKCPFRIDYKTAIELHVKYVHGELKEKVEMRTPTVTVALVRSRKEQPEKQREIEEEQEGLVPGDLDQVLSDQMEPDEQQPISEELIEEQELHDNNEEMLENNDQELIEGQDEELMANDEQETELIEDYDQEMDREEELVEDPDQQSEHAELIEELDQHLEDVGLYEELVGEEETEAVEDQPEQTTNEVETVLQEVLIEVDPLPVGVPDQFEEQQQIDEEIVPTPVEPLDDEVEEGKLFTCPYCEFESPRKTVILTHINKLHNEEWIEKTGLNATRRWLSKRQMREKLKSEGLSPIDQKKERRHKCKFCDYAATTRSTLNCHSRAKHPGCIQPPLYKRNNRSVELQCDQCDYKTIDRHKMQVHIERKHVTECRYACEYCGKKFKVKCDLTSHIRFQHFKTPRVCDVCGKVCSNSNSLHVHQKREHFKPNFECTICHRRMVSQENLDEHIKRQHTQKIRYVCEQCGKVFDYQAKLKQHTMTHTGEKPHSCHVCGKSFARRAVYRQHLLIHTGQRPYVCDICGKTFTQKPGLICHRKMHPGDKPPLPVVFIDHILKKYVANSEQEDPGTEDE